MKATKFIQQADGVSERMVGFMAHLRDNGLAVGIDEFRHSLKALETVNCLNSSEVRLACKAVCTSKADTFDQFDDLFEAYWLNGGREKFQARKKPDIPGSTPRKSFSQTMDEAQSSATSGDLDEADDDDGEGEESAHNGEGKLTGSRLRNIEKVDLREMMTPEALAHAERVAQLLANAMRDRRSRRRRAALRGNALNMRRVMRSSIATGGDPIKLFKQQRPERPVNIVALLDVSGSMMVYSRVFLAFLKGLVSRDQRTDAYLFHTLSLIHISEPTRPY